MSPNLKLFAISYAKIRTQQKTKLTMPIPPDQITGLILAGGRAKRMHGQDKGLVECAGRPLIRYAIDILKPVCGVIYINANRSLDQYRQFGLPTIQDTTSTFDGPLAGILAGLNAASTPYLVVIPCDCPKLEPKMLKRLVDTLTSENAEISIPHDGRRAHPVIMALRTHLASSLTAQLAAGERKIDRWTQKHQCVQIDCSGNPMQFLNVNSPEDLRRMEQQLHSNQHE